MDIKIVSIRMPLHLYKKLREAAFKEHRSFTGEVLFRLENQRDMK